MILNPDREEMRPIAEGLYQTYRDYCLTVSRQNMALSIETCVYVWWLCEQIGALRVADLGSGFTSFVLRAWAAGRDTIDVVSVDDSPEWLERTAQFLKLHHLSTDGLQGPDEFRAGGGGFDVIVFDYASGEDREAMMPAAYERLAHDGFLVFDDAQHLGHHLEMARLARRYGLHLFDVVEQTFDVVARHAVVAHRVTL